MDMIAAGTIEQGRGAAIYRYDALDKQFLADRVAEFRDQVARRIAGRLSEDEFKPLRLMNGLYLQLHAYMLRVAIPYGVLSSAQLRQLAAISETFDRGYGHFTTRQNIQFNWIKLEEAPDILAALAEVDLHALQTSGNCIRNTTTDEFAGAAADEIVDPRVYAELIRQWSTRHPEFSFLPRKFKIAVTGAETDRAAIQVHDIGLQATRGPDGAVGFAVYVGGGLGRTPVIATRIREFLPEPELLGYLEAILRVYNAQGRRDNMYKARIKILLRDMGAAAFTRLVEAEYAAIDRAAYRIDSALVADIAAHFADPPFQTFSDAGLIAADAALAAARRADRGFDRFVARNTHPHRVAGFVSLVVSLKPVGGIPGDATAAQMRAVAALAEAHSFSEIRVTHAQNLVLPHLRIDALRAVYDALVAAKLASGNVGLITDMIACPGLDYCSLANSRSIPMAQAIAERFGDLDAQDEIGTLHVNISGCINACGHHHVGHIGLLGVDKHGVETYQVTLGGSASNDAAVGEILGRAFAADEVVDAVEAIVRVYLAQRRDRDESFKAFVMRAGLEPFRASLYQAA